MLVDDEPAILAALRRCLRREVYGLVAVANAREALAELEAGPIGAVVSDQKMPGMNGVELLERIARRWPATGRILLSGWTAEIPETELAAARLDAVLGKPWDEAELKSAIRAALEAGAARA